MSSTLTKDIITVLSEELDAYKEILGKTYQQINMIKIMDMNGLQAIFQEKDNCIEKINNMEAKLAGMLNGSSKECISDRDILLSLKNIEKTVQDIIRIEENCYTELAILQAGLSEEIRQTDKEVHASKAYNSSKAHPPRFFDVRS